MRLNVRAILQVLRSQNIEVSATSEKDMELSEAGKKAETRDDKLILERKGVRSWNWISTNVEEDGANKGEEEEVEGAEVSEPSEAVVGNELLKNRSGTGEQLGQKL